MSKSETKVIAEQNGYKLSVYDRPPGGPQGLTVRMDGPNGHMEDHAILTFCETFNGNEPLAETQTERNALKVALKLSEESNKNLRKEGGKLRAEVKQLEAQVGKSAMQFYVEMVAAQMAGLKKLLESKLEPE